MRKTQWGGFVEVAIWAFPGVGGDEYHYRIERCQVEQVNEQNFRLRYPASQYLNPWSLERGDVLLNQDMGMVQQDKVLNLGVDDRLISIRVDGQVIYDVRKPVKNKKFTTAYRAVITERNLAEASVRSATIEVKEAEANLGQKQKLLNIYQSEVDDLNEALVALEEVNLAEVEG